jgi:hypothetical protein
VGLLKPHLDDAAFAEVWSERKAGDAGRATHAEAHLRACSDCRARYSTFCGWLDTLRTDAVAEADEALGAERLAAQQAQILRRLEALEHPARVIAFPRFTRPISTQPNGRQRWIAGAAAAGLVVGVGLGQLFELGGSVGRQPEIVGLPQQIARGSLPVAERSGIVPTGSQTNDEAFFDSSELIPAQVRVPDSLQYLNEITPGARDYDPR